MASYSVTIMLFMFALNVFNAHTLNPRYMHISKKGCKRQVILLTYLVCKVLLTQF